LNTTNPHKNHHQCCHHTEKEYFTTASYNTWINGKAVTLIILKKTFICFLKWQKPISITTFSLKIASTHSGREVVDPVTPSLHKGTCKKQEIIQSWQQMGNELHHSEI
jgi:hypothetical protein